MGKKPIVTPDEAMGTEETKVASKQVATAEVEVVHSREVKLQTCHSEGIEVPAGLTARVTVKSGCAAQVGDAVVALGETIELTEATEAKCDAFSLILIEWVK